MRRVGAALRAAWDVARRAGVGAALRRAWRLYAWGDDRVVVFEYVFTGGALPPGSDGLTFDAAGAQDLEALQRLEPRRTARTLSLLRRGKGWLHVARDGDRLVGYRFATRGFFGRGVLAKVIRPGPDQVYIDDIYVHPDYRGRDVAGRLVAAQNRELLAAGIRGGFGSTTVHNVASLRHRRPDARPVLFVDARRRLLYRRCTVSATMPPDIQRMLDTRGA